MFLDVISSHHGGWYKQYFGDSFFTLDKMLREIKSVSCIAPEIYSDKWVKKTIEIIVEGLYFKLNNSHQF